MKNFRLTAAQVLLVLCAAACAATVIYLKYNTDAKVGNFGAEYVSNITLGDLARNLTIGEGADYGG